MGRQTLYFTVANFPMTQKQHLIFKNSNETRRIWGGLAAPVAANSGKKTCDFLMWIGEVPKPFVLQVEMFATMTWNLKYYIVAKLEK